MEERWKRWSSHPRNTSTISGFRTIKRAEELSWPVALPYRCSEGRDRPVRAESTKCTKSRRKMSGLRLLARRGITVDNAALAVVSVATIALFGEAAARTDLGDAQGARDSRYPPLSSIVTEGKIRSQVRFTQFAPHQI